MFTVKTIVFTGGHHTSALVLAKALRRQGHKIIWLGHKYSMRKVENPSLEFQEVRRTGIPFVELKTGKIHQAGVVDWLGLIRGFFRALSLLRRYRPALIVSFGGYLAVPVVVAGWWLGIPSVTHEQTVTAGMANRFLRHFVKKIFLTWPESGRFFPADKSLVVGLPLRPEILKPTRQSQLSRQKPLVLITGGKQGSWAINQVVFQALPTLLAKFQILHQTGRTSTTGDWQKAQALRRNLPASERDSYRPVAYLTDEEMAAALHQAACVVGRSGAHTVYEILLLGKPAVLVPLPFSFAREQHTNAQKAVVAGLAQVVEQTDLTPERLVEAVQSKAAESGRKQSLPLDATEAMVRAILPLLN
jgi:UDP-N-acetylglucosamine--N-acetylmuramyl-(pentapeptide) pyrophosphoryl-undecaprenol N-acetylglucosamine transferase